MVTNPTWALAFPGPSELRIYLLSMRPSMVSCSICSNSLVKVRTSPLAPT
jgi:hypothetical protein